MLPLYSLIYSAALLVLLPFELRKRPKDIRKAWLRDKLGGIDLPLTSPEKESGPLLWVHAVSVGEVIAAAYFIKAFKEKHPEYSIAVSTITDTGQEVARERLSGVAETFYIPFDVGWALRRAVKRLRPSIFVNMETELWPNLIHTLKEEGVPVVVMNGRISDKSFRNYMKIRRFMKRLLEYVDIFCMQDEEYARRITELGVKKDKVEITGSFKFDIKVKDEVLSWVSALKGPVLIAGSTHSGEEDLVVSAYSELHKKYEDLNLIIAPRHPHRFDDVEGLLKERGISYSRRGTLNPSDPKDIRGSVVLLDTVGELSSAYRACDIAIMGGSFIEHGGQNPLEPAYWGVPVVCGPHMFNFPFIKDFYSENAAVEADGSNLARVLDGLLSSPEKRKEVGQNARAMLMKSQGAVEKALKTIERYTNPPKPPLEKVGEGGFSG
jgi:3-deoxy-D-manno-octulosonic-acid transferase